MAEKRKNGVYRANFTYMDPKTGTRKRCRQSLGTRDKREALRREARLRVDLESMPKEEDKKKYAAFSGFARHWLDLHARPNCKHSTIRVYEQVLRVHLVPFFGDAGLREIGMEQVETYKAEKVRSLSPKTVNNHLGILSKLFNSARSWHYAEANPVQDVRPLKLPPQEFQFWEPDQSEAFLTKVNALRPAWYPFFLCALRTGMRLGELCALRWQDVDFVHDVIRVTWSYSHGSLGSPKSGRGRIIPMSSELRGALRQHRHLNGKLVFPNKDGGHLMRSLIKHPFWTCIRAAGIPKIRIHDMRHTFASQLVAKGVPLKVVQELLGHSDIRMTMRYAHLGPTAAAQYVDVLDNKACPRSAPNWKNQRRDLGQTQ